ncbi:MAG: cupin domain-containing protein [Pseudonocardia sp.]|nr:cupin domain-containing protein [Pseudonocardia sp.]
MTRFGRTVVLALGGAALLAGCAQPGQLGGSPATVTVTAPAPAPETAPAPPQPETVRGTIDVPVRVRTPGPAEFSVRTITLAPGETSGWQRHPGTETAVVESGAVTVLEEDACVPRTVTPGSGLFVADGVPHLMRNEGTEPARLVVTYLLAPGAAESTPTPPACDGPPAR